MNRIKPGLIVLAALLLAALLTLLFYRRDVYLPRAVPAVETAAPAPPAVPPARIKEKPREKSAAGPAAVPGKPAEVPGKRGTKRKKRVSPLREPGEALGGGVKLDQPDKTKAGAK